MMGDERRGEGYRGRLALYTTGDASGVRPGRTPLSVRFRARQGSLPVSGGSLGRALNGRVAFGRPPNQEPQPSVALALCSGDPPRSDGHPLLATRLRIPLCFDDRRHPCDTIRREHSPPIGTPRCGAPRGA